MIKLHQLFRYHEKLRRYKQKAETMNKSNFPVFGLLVLAVILSACATGNPSRGLQSEDQVATTAVATLSVPPTETPTVVAPTPSAKLEDFANKTLIGENDRFSVFTLDSADPTNFEQTGLIIIYDKFTDKVHEIVGTFTLLTSTIIFNDDSGEYALLSVGTYILRTAFVISLSDKRQAVDEFCIAMSHIFWNDYLIYNNCDVFDNRPWGAGEAPSIVAVNLKTGAVTEIAKSDALRHFNVKGIVGNNLQYEEISVRLEADWSNSDAQITTDKAYDLSALSH
jgi:hypothetical protein